MADDTGWQKPSDIMRVLKKGKKKSILRKTSSGSFKSSDVLKETHQAGRGRSGTKRLNPFGSQQCKKRSNPITDPGIIAPVLDSSPLLGVLSGFNNEPQNYDPVKEVEYDTGIVEDESGIGEQKQDLVLNRTSPCDKSQNNPTGEDTFPIDWSLRSKARFTSEKSFNWCTDLKSSIEAAGVLEHTRGSQQPNHHSLQKKLPDAASQKAFQSHCMYWIHPNIPWMKMFPRLTGESKVGKPSFLFQQEELQKAYLTEWEESYSSLFHQLRSGLCPYFYICTYQFTVLFRAISVGGKSDLHAMLTPSTRGLREALKIEGIEYCLPLSTSHKKEDLCDKNIETSENSTEDPASEYKDDVLGDSEIRPDTRIASDEEEDIAQTNEGASDWLQSIGLNAAKFKSLDPNKVKISREGYKIIDHRPESLVLVQGSDTQALFNYLLNCRSCIAPSGSQAGIPPTLLAPCPFKGATLKALKAKSCTIHSGEKKVKHCLEIFGPILPHSLHGLKWLFAQTHDQYHVSYRIHDVTTPFNACTPDSDLEDSQQHFKDLMLSGLPEAHIKNVSKANDLGKGAVREMECTNGLFKWTTSQDT